MSASASSPHPPSVEEAVRLILQKNFDADSKICFLTLLKIIDNILQKPGNEKVRSLRTANATIRSKIMDKHGHHLLMACGFVHEPADLKWNTEERLVLKEDKEDTQILIKARHTLARIATLELGLQAGDIPPYKVPPAPVSISNKTTTTTTSFDVYSGNRFDGQSAAIGANLGPPKNWKSKTEQELEALKQREAKLQAKMAKKPFAIKAKVAVDRQWTVFLPGQTHSVTEIAAPTSSAAAAAAAATTNRPAQQQRQKLIQSSTQPTVPRKTGNPYLRTVQQHQQQPNAAPTGRRHAARITPNHQPAKKYDENTTTTSIMQRPPQPSNSPPNVTRTTATTTSVASAGQSPRTSSLAAIHPSSLQFPYSQTSKVQKMTFGNLQRLLLELVSNRDTYESYRHRKIVFSVVLSVPDQTRYDFNVVKIPKKQQQQQQKQNNNNNNNNNKRKKYEYFTSALFGSTTETIACRIHPDLLESCFEVSANDLRALSRTDRPRCTAITNGGGEAVRNTYFCPREWFATLTELYGGTTTTANNNNDALLLLKDLKNPILLLRKDLENKNHSSS